MNDWQSTYLGRDALPRDVNDERRHFESAEFRPEIRDAECFLRKPMSL